MIVKGKTYFTNYNNKIQCPYLDCNIKSDTVIIGGGITGLITAYYLLENNIDVILIEKARIAYGSTSITTALLQYELDDNVNKLRKYYSNKDLEEIYLACSNSLNDLINICNKIDCKYQNKHSLLYSNKDLDQKELHDEYFFREEINLDVKFVNYDNEIKYGILSKNSGISFNPYEFSVKLAMYLINRGISIYENTEVLDINYEKKILNTTYNYQISYNNVIVATGYDISKFTNKKYGDLYYTYNIVTNKIDFSSDLLIRDNKDPYNYYRVDDNRIIAGGLDTKDYNCNKEEAIYNQLLINIKNLYKVDCKIEYKYLGVFKSTKDNLGYFGSDGRCIFALGYGANGIVFANIGGKIIVDILKGKTNELSKYFKLER